MQFIIAEDCLCLNTCDTIHDIDGNPQYIVQYSTNKRYVVIGVVASFDTIDECDNFKTLCHSKICNVYDTHRVVDERILNINETVVDDLAC